MISTFSALCRENRKGAGVLFWDYFSRCLVRVSFLNQDIREKGGWVHYLLRI